MTCRRLALLTALFVTSMFACGAPAQAPTRPHAVLIAGPTTNGTQPTKALPRFRALNDTCALAQDGRIFCFGIFWSSVEVTPDEVNEARPVPGITDAVMFSGRSNLCYVHRSAPERITCLQRDPSNRTPTRTTDHVLPEPVRELWDACAITTSSAVYCWGSSEGHHFLTGAAWPSPGVGHTVTQVPPTKLPLPPVRNFVRTLNSLCLATEDGRIGCWGANNFVDARDALRRKVSPKGVQAMRWLDAPKGSIGAFTAGLHTDYFESYKNALCFQSKEGTFSCENPSETKGLVSWLNTHAINEVHPLDDAVVGLGADGSLRAFRLRATSKVEMANVLGDRAVPGVVAFGSHHDHACVLDRAGTVSCLGVRDDGWLGNGERLSSPTPVRVDVPAPIELSSNGGSQFCTRQENGTVHCWGGFDMPEMVAGRQLTELELPEPSAGLVGGENLCTKGKTHWWCTSPFVRPSRRDGFTPLKDPSGRLVPLDADLTIDTGIGIFVSMPNGERSVFYYSSARKPLVLARAGAKGEQALPRTRYCVKTAAGSKACAERSGFVYWVEVPPAVEPRELFASRSEVALLTMNGELFFGSRTEQEPVRWEPAPRLTGLRDAISVRNPDQRAADSICVLRDTGDVLCRGHNRYGELGDGTYEPHDDFRPVVGLGRVRAIAEGGEGACTLDESSTVHCWGGDRSGALGQGSKRHAEAPMPIIMKSL